MSDDEIFEFLGALMALAKAADFMVILAAELHAMPLAWPGARQVSDR